MAREQTLILIKPDGARRRLTGLIIDRLDAAGLVLAGAKMVSVSEKLAREHYQEHAGKHFYEDLIRYIRGEYHAIPDCRVLALVYEGENAIELARRIAGATNPEKADPSTLRGSFGRVTTGGQIENLLHASDGRASAEREIKLWFSPHEIIRPLYPVRNSDGAKSPVWAG
jgi:nucleoside-diphosphate kinase